MRERGKIFPSQRLDRTHNATEPMKSSTTLKMDVLKLSCDTHILPHLIFSLQLDTTCGLGVHGLSQHEKNAPIFKSTPGDCVKLTVDFLKRFQTRSIWYSQVLAKVGGTNFK